MYVTLFLIEFSSEIKTSWVNWNCARIYLTLLSSCLTSSSVFEQQTNQQTDIYLNYAQTTTICIFSAVHISIYLNYAQTTTNVYSLQYISIYLNYAQTTTICIFSAVYLYLPELCPNYNNMYILCSISLSLNHTSISFKFGLISKFILSRTLNYTKKKLMIFTKFGNLSRS